MNCTCCGGEGEDMGKLTVRREAMYRCDPCKPAQGACSGRGYHFYSASDMPRPATIEVEKKKKKR